MRKGWEYKRLDECANIEYGTRVVQKKDSGTLYPVYGGGGETFRMDKFNREDCLIVARFAMSRRCVRFVNGKFFLNDSGLSVKAGDKLYQSYLNYNIISLNDDIYHLGKGAAQRNLDVKSFKKLTIAIPPQSTQLAIVSELDKINELIRLKKEQLKDFDNLAQSLFYEMFGDPVENEKGWEVKKLNEIVSDNCSISYGIVQPGDGVENGVPVVRPVDMTKTFVSRKGLKNTTKEISDSYKRTILKGNEILMCVRGTTGLISMATPELQGCNVTRGIAPIECGPTCDKWFVFYQILNPAIQHHIAEYTRGIALKQINMKDVRDIPLCLPPLSLQRLFAQRIEQIEREKSEVQKSIQDLETLLASRMQYWFE